MTFPSRAGNVLYPIELSVPVNSREEQDRLECVALDKAIEGGEHKLAQWIIDHSYTQAKVAEWLGCGQARVSYLCRWARDGFVGSYRDKKSRSPADNHHGDKEPLKTNDNSPVDPDWEPGVAPPSQMLSNVLDSIHSAKAVAEAYRKIFKVSSFDLEAKAKIKDEITNLIAKWQRAKSTLDTKGQGNG